MAASFAVRAEEQMPADNTASQPIIETPQVQEPVVEAPKIETPPETTQPPQTIPAIAEPEKTPVHQNSPNHPERKSARNDSDRKPDNDKKSDRRDVDKRKWDRKDNERKKHRDHYYRPLVVHKRAPPKIIYIYPQSYYPAEAYNGNYSSYPSDYQPSFHVGGYLPPERQWRPLPDYALYGLPAPRREEVWVYNDRDAVLINDKTSRIISAFVLAVPID